MRKKPDSCSCWLPAELPDIVQGDERGVGLVFLTGIDGVSIVDHMSIAEFVEDRDQPRKIGKTVVPDAEQSEPVLADLEHSLAIEFILLAMFQPIEESISIRSGERHPRMGAGATPATTSRSR